MPLFWNKVNEQNCLILKFFCQNNITWFFFLEKVKKQLNFSFLDSFFLSDSLKEPFEKEIRNLNWESC